MDAESRDGAGAGATASGAGPGRLRARQSLLTAILAIWLLGFGLVAGPMRIELAHSYGHWLTSLGSPALPALTRAVALPVLSGTGTAGAAALFYCYWALLGLGPIVLAVLIWRARDAMALGETWLYFGSGYAVLVAATMAAVAFGLCLPFFLI